MPPSEVPEGHVVNKRYALALFTAALYLTCCDRSRDGGDGESGTDEPVTERGGRVARDQPAKKRYVIG